MAELSSIVTLFSPVLESCHNGFSPSCSELKPGARAIADPWDDSVAVSPADCRMVCYTTLAEAAEVWVKGRAFTVETLLGPEGRDVAPLFAGGSIVVARLAPQDYHRWHMPVTGRIVRQYAIDGALYTVNPIAIR